MAVTAERAITPRPFGWWLAAAVVAAAYGIFLIVTALFSLGYWVLMPAWPLGATYTKGLLGVDQRTTVQEAIGQAALELRAHRRAAVGFRHGVAVLGQVLRNHAAHAGVVLDHQHLSAA